MKRKQFIDAIISLRHGDIIKVFTREFDIVPSKRPDALTNSEKLDSAGIREGVYIGRKYIGQKSILLLQMDSQEKPLEINASRITEIMPYGTGVETSK